MTRAKAQKTSREKEVLKPMQVLPLWLTWILMGALLACVYGNSLYGAFVFDDAGSVVDNGTIRDIRQLSLVLAAPPRGGATTDARPLVNLSFAVNYALHGLHPFGYHLINVIVHWLNTGLIILLLKRLLAAPSSPSSVQRNSNVLAALCAILWCLNPIQTSVVSYISQRAESMACFFYLVALNINLGFGRNSRLRSLACVPVLLGGFCKEIIVTAPVVSFVLQRWSTGESWVQCWSVSRREIFLQLVALTPMIALAVLHGGRSGTAAGGESHAVTATEYLLAQGYVIPRYLLSMLIPYWVCADYGIYPPVDSSTSIVGLGLLLGLFVWSAYSVVCGHSVGLPVFCAAIFLAPTSSILPITTQIGGEHRAYLPSLAFIVLCCLAAFHAIGSRKSVSTQYRRWISLALIASVAIFSSVSTFRINYAFESLSSFWERILVRSPMNLRARQNLAVLQLKSGKTQEAFDWFEPLLHDPRQSIAANLEAADLAEQGKMFERARGYLQTILEQQPAHPTALVLKARLALSEGEPLSAIAICDEVLKLHPNQASAFDVLGRALRLLTQSLNAATDREKIRELDERAEAMILRALELAPWSADTRFTLAGLYLDQGRDDLAEIELRQCLMYQPTRADAWYWSAVLHLEQGDKSRALAEVRASLTLKFTPEAEALEQQILAVF